ncbi:PREDICTED: transcription factor GTE1-like isoform X2 [Prunus mume]|uniref:Transcription factor GTE1-like isoform X2 n=1 Tax=Prunus mume TaxID=102107 RepID=A0ABM0NK26_PRUMU|nr:PREDICTED: transcription factor GTE1-like isoform X2 [Prunus mume]
MEPVSSSNPDLRKVAVAAEVEGFGRSVDEISAKVDTLEKRVNEVERFYLTTGSPQLTNSKGSSIVKDKQLNLLKKQQQDASRREVTATKRMQELMRQFASIFRQITQHEWAWPFKEPVDVESLGLHDYYQVIEKPMDFGTIKNKMEAKDGTAYKNVREIYADVRLVFKNAMKYNDDKDDVHVMAKTLLEKFEEKWLKLLPKVVEEETRRVDEEAEARLHTQLAQEAAYASMAKDLSTELVEIDLYLKDLREMVVQKCSKALAIVAQNNPSFQASAQEVDLDIDAQSECTLWRLKVFVKEALKVQGKSSEGTAGNKVTASKRNREISDAVPKTNAKRTKKLSCL